MKKELKYFSADGAYGGSQDWFPDRWMNIGGCGALTACDSCIYLDMYKGISGIYPYRKDNITKEDYINFGMMMKPYLSPRMGGIDRLEIYIEGMEKYLLDRGCEELILTAFDGNKTEEEADNILISQIDKGFPLPCLTLHHKAPVMDNYVWHWYLLTGYEKTADTLMVKAVTYGNYKWLDFHILWDTGHKKRGGLVIYDVK